MSKAPPQANKRGGRKTDAGNSLVSSNKRVRHNYSILKVYEAGLALTGTEVKSLRRGRASLIDGFAQFSGGELWLENVHIPEYTQGSWTNHAPRRRRKLLLHRRELTRIFNELEGTGLTVVPLKIYFKDGHAKVEIGVAQGKKNYDKRQTLRERQDRRDAQRALRMRNR